MKAIILSLVTFCFPLVALAQVSGPVTFDLEKSRLEWTGKKVTGSHNGVLKLKTARGQLNPDMTVAGTFEVAMDSIRVVDIEDPKYNKKLADHLFSPDFFDVSNFPTATFQISDASPIPVTAPNQPNVQIRGNLTVKGITQPISFPALVSVEGKKVSAKGTATIDRTNFDVKYGSGKFFEGLGDKLIYDEFTVGVELYGELA